jgi:hypothetical protein
VISVDAKQKEFAGPRTIPFFRMGAYLTLSDSAPNTTVSHRPRPIVKLDDATWLVSV